jgi:hypothetical protein
MNAMDVLRAVRRHPVISGTCIAVTVIGAAGIYKTVPTTYQNGASYAVLGPDKGIGDNGKLQQLNPWSRAGDAGAQIAASTLVTTGNSSTFQAALKRSGVTSTSSLQVSTSGGGIVVDVTTTSKSAPATGADIPKIFAALKGLLQNNQARVGAPAGSYYQLWEQSSPGVPGRVSSSKVKTAGVAGVLGLLVTLMIVLFYDWRLRLRQRPGRRHDARLHDVAEASPTSETAAMYARRHAPISVASAPSRVSRTRRIRRTPQPVDSRADSASDQVAD